MKSSIFKYIIVFILLAVFTTLTLRKVHDGNLFVGSNPNLDDFDREKKEALKDIVFGTELVEGRFGFKREMFAVASSKDKESIFYIRPSKTEKNSIGVNIKGDTKYNVDLLLYDKKSGKTKSIEICRPMVSFAKFSHDERYIAFLGGNKLSIYDVENERLLFKEETVNDFVNYFGWGQSENKIYTESKRNANGIIYDLENLKTIMNYEVEKNWYPKAAIDSTHYYCTLQRKEFREGALENDIRTLICSREGSHLAEFPNGRFRGSYEKSFIQVGKNEFGLYYIEDVLAEFESEMITDQYVYDAKFVWGGKVAYICQKRDSDDNKFVMGIFNSSEKDSPEEFEYIEVSGSSFALTPDGRYGFVGGNKEEVVDFKTGSVVSKAGSSPKDCGSDGEQKLINETIVGALNIFYKYEMTGIKELESIDRYYMDTENPSQWANFDMKAIMNERQKAGFVSNSNYVLSIRVDYMDLYETGEMPSASVRLRAFGQNSSGQRFGDDHCLELVKKEGQWYVTGFSTFPGKSDRERAMKAALKYVNMASEGGLGSFDFENRSVKIGQVQFWRSSRSEFASDIEYADCCKVYLKIDGQSMYKMTMERAIDNSWKFKCISNENLSGLT